MRLPGTCLRKRQNVLATRSAYGLTRHALAPYARSSRATADPAELGKLGERLAGEIQRLRAIGGGAYGSIHAILHRGNIKIDGDGQFVTFDFGHCGFGLHACDLAVIARLPANVRKAESDPTPRPAAEPASEQHPPHVGSSPRGPHIADD